MAMTASVCDSFLLELLGMATHQAGDAYMLALYTSSASLSAATTVYSSTNEVPNSGTYSAGGQALVGFVTGLSGHKAYIDWTTDPQFTGATIAAAGALIYNATRGNKAVAVLDFGQVITSTNGTFDVTLPAPGATAVIRIKSS